jgi:serine/threonine-protein kinase
MSEVFRRPSPTERFESERALGYSSLAEPGLYPAERLQEPATSMQAPHESVDGFGSAASRDSYAARGALGPVAGLPAPPRALSPREVREQMRAEAQMRVDVEEDRKVWGRVTSLQRRFQKYRRQALFAGSTAFVSAGALMGTMVDSDVFPLFAISLGPLILSVVGLARKTMSLRRDNVDPSDVLSKPIDVLVREYDPAALLGQVARETGPASGMVGSPYMEAVRRATADRTAILEAVRKMSKTDRRMLPDVVPTVNALVERIASLAPTLHRLDADLQPTSIDRLNERIADVERQTPLTPDAERKLALLHRQRSSVEDLMKRRETLLGQLESAGLLLQNLKLDLIKVRSAGVNASVQGVNNATQEARALSTEISYVLGAADEVRDI